MVCARDVHIAFKKPTLTRFGRCSIGVLTQDGGVAASINGLCAPSGEDFDGLILVQGSNLYVFSWFCLVSVLDISLRWKAAQAMAFAHASQGATNSSGPEKEGDENDDADDDDDEI
jgi:hypothetical protein